MCWQRYYLTRCRIGAAKSDSSAAELFGDGPEVGFCWRMIRWTVPHSEKTCFTPSCYGIIWVNNALIHSLGWFLQLNIGYTSLHMKAILMKEWNKCLTQSWNVASEITFNHCTRQQGTIENCYPGQHDQHSIGLLVTCQVMQLWPITLASFVY